MEKYYEDPSSHHEPTTDSDDATNKSKALVSEYDRYRNSLMDLDDNGGWASELRRYLRDRPVEVSKETDIVQWWQVRYILNISITFK